MDIFEKDGGLFFPTKREAEQFLQKVKNMAYKIDVVTVNDVLINSGRAVKAEYHRDGLKYGYARKEIRKWKAEKIGSEYLVRIPAPGKMIRGENGYWTTENVRTLEMGDDI